MEECIKVSDYSQIQNCINQSQKLIKEMEEELSIRTESNLILKRVKKENPEFYKIELIYQKYRTNFSKAYFSGSEWNRGDCLYDWYKDQSTIEDVFLELLLHSFFDSINKFL